MSSAMGPRAGRRAVFDSLFPPPSITAPTSLTVPVLGYESGANLSDGYIPESRDVSHSFKRAAALGSAKRIMSDVVVRKEHLSPEGVQAAKARLKANEPSDFPIIMETALAEWPNVLHQEDDLVDWYLDTLRNDFYVDVEPALHQIWFQVGSVCKDN